MKPIHFCHSWVILGGLGDRNSELLLFPARSGCLLQGKVRENLEKSGKKIISGKVRENKGKISKTGKSQGKFL